ncbi:MAG: trypsin-like peptidase domain-containing protein [Gracilibacteraceae bacterium]|jgi:serine protease Do|nr:trypsin-like peptidase domain-containing protein [Gracilibacteraceae bacterium]
MTIYRENGPEGELPSAEWESAGEESRDDRCYEYVIPPADSSPPEPEPRQRADLPAPEPPGRKGGGVVFFALLAFCCAILGSFVTLTLAPEIYGRSQPGVINNGNSVTIQQAAAGSGGMIAAEGESPIVAVAEAVGETVVGIANFQHLRSWFGNGELTEVSSGSGFIIDAANGYIVTNNHVVEDAEDLIISLADGRDVQGIVVGGDARTDLAVVKIEEIEGLRAATLGDSGALRVGQYVVAIGNPGGTEFARTVTWGIISATDRFLMLEGEASFKLIQTDAAINPGNSGGPLVNFDGHVIGINSAKNQSYGYEGMGFAIPISDALPVITQLLETGRVRHPALEIHIDDRYNEAYASYKGWPEGCYVAAVVTRGGADRAGIRAGDIIMTVNGEKVENSLKLTHRLFTLKPGDEVSVEYYRDGETYTAEVTLGEIVDNG